MKTLQELAEQAAAHADPDFRFEEFVKQAVRSYGNLMLFGESLYSFDYEKIYAEYAGKLGKKELDEMERKQAILDYVLGDSE